MSTTTTTPAPHFHAAAVHRHNTGVVLDSVSLGTFAEFGEAQTVAHARRDYLGPKWTVIGTECVSGVDFTNAVHVADHSTILVTAWACRCWSGDAEVTR